MPLPNRFRVALVTCGLLAALFVQGCGGGGSGDNPPPAGNPSSAADTTAPTVPQNLAATAISTTQVNLTWSASTDSGGAGLAGYRVLRGGVEIATTTQRNYSDTALTANTAYSYTVRAYDNATPANVSANSSPPASVTTLALDTTPPTVPQNLMATAISTTQVNLTWSASTDSGGAGLAGYRVLRGGAQIATTTVPNYSDSGLTANTTYVYTVRAYDNATPANVSANSSPANVTTLATPDTTAPTVPQNLVATAVSSSQVNLTWTASTDSGGAGLAGYRVLRGGAQIATTAVNNYSDSGLAANTAYTYTVRAYDNATPANVSVDSSPPASVTTLAMVGGLDARPSNTSCLAGARPTASDTASVVRVFPALSFSSPILALQAPGDATRWFVVQQGGSIRKFSSTAGTTTTASFIDITARVASGGELGLLGMAFHPNFPTDRRVFLSYTAGAAGSRVSRISSFLTMDSGQTLDPASERILLTLNQPEDNHNGGNIAFGPDGFLYIGFGDGGGGDDQHTQNGPIGNGQSLTTMLAKILRIDVGSVETATTYTIPSTNPFAANPMCGPATNAQSCPEIYAYGVRNPWRWSFDRQSGQLWLGDVGQGSFEEVDIVVRGGNYGWRCREGLHNFGSQTGCPTTGFTAPVAEYDHTLGSSITGGYVYRGPQTTALRGRYIFGDFGSGRMWTLLPDNAGGFTRTDLLSSGLSISSFAQANDGELYVVDYNGGLYRLVFQAGGGGGTVPTSLAATGCVDTMSPTQPAAGLIPYSVNAPFWSDGAVKDRWIALPNGQNVTVGASGDWDFPNGTVLVKNFRLGANFVETRLFMHHTDGSWAGYTYQWNDAQTDATLVMGGATKLWGAQTWLYPSEANCLQCHTAVAGRSLGLETSQMNRDFTYPQTGRTANQITTLNAINTLTPAIAGDPATLPAIPDPAGASGTLADRARSYLHTNCSQCHRPAGPTPVNLDLRYTTALSATNACNAAPQAGNLGLGGTARIILPGNAANSILVARVNRRNDPNQMPPIGSNQIDTAGVALLTQWINGLATCN